MVKSLYLLTKFLRNEACTYGYRNFYMTSVKLRVHCKQGRQNENNHKRNFSVDQRTVNISRRSSVCIKFPPNKCICLQWRYTSELKVLLWKPQLCRRVQFSESWTKNSSSSHILHGKKACVLTRQELWGYNFKLGRKDWKSFVSPTELCPTKKRRNVCSSHLTRYFERRQGSIWDQVLTLHTKQNFFLSPSSGSWNIQRLSWWLYDPGGSVFLVPKLGHKKGWGTFRDPN